MDYSTFKQPEHGRRWQLEAGLVGIDIFGSKTGFYRYTLRGHVNLVCPTAYKTFEQAKDTALEHARTLLLEAYDFLMEEEMNPCGAAPKV